MFERRKEKVDGTLCHLYSATASPDWLLDTRVSFPSEGSSWENWTGSQLSQWSWPEWQNGQWVWLLSRATGASEREREREKKCIPFTWYPITRQSPSSVYLNVGRSLSAATAHEKSFFLARNKEPYCAWAKGGELKSESLNLTTN